jgi:ArsR family transcriptional regulator
MGAKRQLRYDALADILKAIAHPTRLLILEELSERSRCVSELTEMIGADTSTVSKHLTLMKSAGIIENQKNGNKVIYSLRVPCVMKFMGCIESVLETDAKDKMELLNTRLV